MHREDGGGGISKTATRCKDRRLAPGALARSTCTKKARVPRLQGTAIAHPLMGSILTPPSRSSFKGATSFFSSPALSARHLPASALARAPRRLATSRPGSPASFPAVLGSDPPPPPPRLLPRWLKSALASERLRRRLPSLLCLPRQILPLDSRGGWKERSPPATALWRSQRSRPEKEGPGGAQALQRLPLSPIAAGWPSRVFALRRGWTRSF